MSTISSSVRFACSRPSSFARTCRDDSFDAMREQQSRFTNMADSIITRIDEMGSRIDDLEKSVGELIQQAGVESSAMEKNSIAANTIMDAAHDDANNSS